MSRTAWIVGGVSTIAAAIGALFVNKKAKETETTIKNAIEGLNKTGVPMLPAGSGVTVPVRITGYWPFTAKTGERKMEGGVNDRLGYPLHTLEEFQSGKAPYVAVSGDDAIWPYGQRISLSNWPGVTFRIVDTGDHFSSYKDKVFRAAGHEPLDVCVDSSSTHVVAFQDATIYPGDDYKSKDKRKRDPREVAFQKIGKPTAVGDFDLLGADSV